MKIIKDGTKVRIVGFPDGQITNSGLYFNQEMRQHIGKIMTIASSRVHNKNTIYYRLVEDKQGWTWDKHLISPLDKHTKGGKLL